MQFAPPSGADSPSAPSVKTAPDAGAEGGLGRWSVTLTNGGEGETLDREQRGAR
jgi:hypothetical protein